MQSPNVDQNQGFGSRNKLFRVGGLRTGAYKPEGARFFGKLNLDLSSCESGLPPGTKVRIELDKAPDSFILFKDPSDTEEYKFKILDCVLYVPIAQLSLPVFNQLNSLLNEKSVTLHFRRTEIREVSLPKNKIEYSAENLFSGDTPCRVIICFIDNNRKAGNYENPYEFQRFWIHKTTEASSVFNRDHWDRYLEEKLSRLERLEQKLDLVLQGKGKGKKSAVEETSPGLMTRLRKSFQQNEDGSSTSSGRQDEEEPPPYEELRQEAIEDATAEKTVYIKKVELILNGAPLGNTCFPGNLIDYFYFEQMKLEIIFRSNRN